jgi:hypothetical protein
MNFYDQFLFNPQPTSTIEFARQNKPTQQYIQPKLPPKPSFKTGFEPKPSFLNRIKTRISSGWNSFKNFFKFGKGIKKRKLIGHAKKGGKTIRKRRL